jgi:hypothetical protein
LNYLSQLIYTIHIFSWLVVVVVVVVVGGVLVRPALQNKRMVGGVSESFEKHFCLCGSSCKVLFISGWGGVGSLVSGDPPAKEKVLSTLT